MYVYAIIPPNISYDLPIGSLTPVYVPDESVDRYRKDCHWGKLYILPMSANPTVVPDVIIQNTEPQKYIKQIKKNKLLIHRGNKFYTVGGIELKD